MVAGNELNWLYTSNMITQNALLRLCEKRGSFLGACRPNIRLRAIGKPIFAKLFSWTAVFFANYARACKTTVHKDSQFQIPFRISQSNGKKEIQKQISQRWNPFLDFAFYCKSEIRILKCKSRFPNRAHPKYWKQVIFHSNTLEMKTTYVQYPLDAKNVAVINYILQP